MQTVLIVDDDPTIRHLLEVVLAVEGFAVHVADSAVQALQVLAMVSVDLVTIDVVKPGLGGWELSARLRADPLTAHVRQMLVSGEDLSPERAVLLGIDAVLLKPFDFTSFTQVLRNMLSQPPTGAATLKTAAQLDQILGERLIVPVFQPIIDLQTGDVVGVEALARGPEDSIMHSPAALFEAAQVLGRLHELDCLCRFTAISNARAAAPLTPELVFVNVEPGTVELPMTEELRALLADDLPFQVVVEFTERALTHRLASLLRHAAEIRERGNVIALDDLGVDPQSIALLPLLQPEIVKLDMSLLADDLPHEAAQAAVAVAPYAETTGARVIAEGIETEQQLATALALGAHWGQGYYFARPAPLTALAGLRIARTRPSLALARTPSAHIAANTPYSLAAVSGTSRHGDRALLRAISGQLERQALTLGDVVVLLLVIQDSLDARTLTVPLTELGASAAVVGVFGRGMELAPALGVVGVDLADTDPLLQEWAVVVLGPHNAALMAARQVDHEGDRVHFDFVLSHERELVVDVARSLLSRFSPHETVVRTTALRREGQAVRRRQDSDTPR